jgi:hypothetical protein
MPAPTRPAPFTTEPNSLNVPKGVVGVYTDAETDAELAAVRAWVTEQITNAVTGGTVDLSDYATNAALTDAVQDLTAQLAGRYTKDEVDAIVQAAVADLTATIEERPTLPAVEALLAALPAGSAAPVVHTGAVPLPAAGTPQSLIDAYADKADGFHYFAGSSSLVVIRRKPLPPTFTEHTLLILDPMRVMVARVSDYVPLPGTVNPPVNWLETQTGGQFARVEVVLPSDAFAPVGAVNVYEAATKGDVAAAIAGVQVGTLTPEQVQAIVDAVVASGFDLSGYYDKAEVDALAKSISDQAGVWDQELRDQTFAELQLVATSIGNSLALKADKTAVAAVAADVAGLASNQQTFLTQSDIDHTNQLLQGLATATQDCLSGLEAKADKTTVTSLGTTLMNAVTEVKESTDAAIAGKADQAEFAAFQGYFGTMEADYAEKFRLLNLGFSYVVQKTDFDAAIALKADKATTYTKPEVDAAIASAAAGTVDLSSYAMLDNYAQDVTANLMKAQAFVFTKANTTLGFIRTPEHPDGKPGVQIGGPTGEVQFLAYMSDLAAYAPLSTTTLITTQMQALYDSVYTKAEADARYAAKADNTQAILAKTVVAQAVGFGDSNTPPAALAYIDTDEGYGPRLVFSVGVAHDMVVMKADLDELPQPDLRPYATNDAVAATYATKKDVVDAWQRVELIPNVTFTNGANLPIVRRVFGDSWQLVGEARTMTPIPTDNWFQVATIPKPWPERNTPDFAVATTDAAYLPGIAIGYISADGKVWIKPSIVAPRYFTFNAVATCYPRLPVREGDAEPAGEYITDRPTAEAT